MLHKCIKTVSDTIQSRVKLTVQSNIWISNKGMLIMVSIHGNRYRSMFGLYMMFLRKAGKKSVINQDGKNISKMIIA